MYIFRNAYVSCKDTEDRTKWINCIRSEINHASLRCNATNVQLGSYLMWKLETTSQEAEIPQKSLVNCTGLQEFVDKPVWVLNERVHIDEKGEALDPMDSPYIWIHQLLDKNLAAKVLVCRNKIEQRRSLSNLISALKNCYQQNTPAALLTLGAQILCLHYESFHKIGKFLVPATVVFGKINCGKSLATKAALSMLGIQDSNYITFSTESKMRSLTSQTSLGVVLDDPKDANEISQKILYHFDLAKACNHTTTVLPKCTFITSMNFDCLDKLCRLHHK